ncbi:hypothetical protein CB1_012719005 [Camelus ferus]|nr:hypothetical protein CB1_012719005 [Camelus ferus]
MFCESVTGVWEGKCNFFRQRTHSAGEAVTKTIGVLWWGGFSKLPEFMDTFFSILRKNPHQIAGLHIYQHATSSASGVRDRMHDFSDCPLHKLLRSDLQEEGGLTEESAAGPPERLVAAVNGHSGSFSSLENKVKPRRQRKD